MKVFVVSFIVATCSIAFVTSTTSVLSCMSGGVSTGPAPISVTVNDCTKLPCTVSKGSTVNTKVTFKAVNNTSTLFGIVFDVRGDTILEANAINDVCNQLTEGSCPVNKGERITLSFSTDLTSVLPLGTGVSAEVTIFDKENGVLHACYIVPINVIAA